MKLKYIPFLILTTMLVNCSPSSNNNPIIPVKVLTGLEIVEPTKTTYSVGEELDLNGLLVYAVYSDDSKEQISDYQVSGFDSSKEGEVTITISFDGKTASFVVTIENKIAYQSMSIVEPKRKFYRVGDEFDDSGLQVFVLKNNNDKEEVFDYQISGFNSLETGEKEITITYLSFQKSFSVFVTNENTPKAERVYQHEVAISTFTGQSYELKPVVMPEGAYENIQYVISNPEVIEINKTTINGLSAGSSLVTIYNDDNNNQEFDEDEANVTVSVLVKEADASIKLSLEQDITIEVGQTKTINPKIEGIGSSSFGYYSTNLDVADYANGKLVAKKSGECEIYVTYNGYRATSKVTVVDKNDNGHLLASHVYALENIIHLNVDDIRSFGYKVYPENGEYEKLYYSIKNNEIIDIIDDKIVAKKAGRTSFTVSLNENMYPYDIVTVEVSDGNIYEGYYDDYYGDLTWENGADLKQKLHDIISKDKKALKYKDNWDTNLDADINLYNFTLMDSVYGNDNVLKKSTQSGWQREHAFAASLMTSTTTSNAINSLGRSTDFHNLYAAYANGNGSRTNKNLGVADIYAPDFTDFGTYKYTRNWFEPTSDVDKGKLARAIFYMDTMYNEVETAKYSDTTSLTVNLPAINVLSKNIDYKRISISNFTNPGEQYVDLVNYYKEAVRIDNPSLNDSQVTTRAYELYMETSLPYAIGGLEYLLDWNANPVSRAEMHHNVSVYSFNSQSGGGIQGNRNPFVDYPELVDYIYGEFKDVPGNIKDLRPTFVDLEMDKDEIYNYAIGENYQNKYDVGDTISATSLDLKGVKYNFDIVDVDESVIDNPYTFIEDDIGYKEYSFATDKNDITIKLNVGESFVKASEFDASKNYYLSADGNNFATTTINSKGQLLMSSEDYASVTFEETDVEGQYYVKIEDKNGSIYLGYSGSGTNLTNNKTVWKVQYLNNGGFVLVEAGGRFLGLASKGATEAKAYAGSNLKVESNYPPVYLYIQK